MLLKRCLYSVCKTEFIKLQTIDNCLIRHYELQSLRTLNVKITLIKNKQTNKQTKEKNKQTNKTKLRETLFARVIAETESVSFFGLLQSAIYRFETDSSL